MSSLQSLANESYSFLPPNAQQPTSLPRLNSGLDDVLLGSAKLAKARTGAHASASNLLNVPGGNGGVARSVSGVQAGGQNGNIDGGAAYLLATHGINAPSLAHQVNHFSQVLPSLPQAPQGESSAQSNAAAGGSMDATSDPTSPSVPLPTFLQQHKEKIILSAISDTLRRAVRDSEERWMDRCDQEWKSQRSKILEEMGVGANGQSSAGAMGESMAKSRMGASVLGASRFGSSTLTAPTTSGSTSLDSINAQKRMMEYDAVIKTLNANRKENKPFPVVGYMKEKVNSDKIPDLDATYTLLTQLLKESPDGASPGERAFAKGYMAEESTRERCAVLTRLIANGSLWLERIFIAHVNKVLADHIKEIPVGGIPGFRSKVSAFVNWKFNNHPVASQLEKVAHTFLWAEIFYLLRGGKVQEALELAEEKQHAMPRKDRNFAALFKAWATSASDRSIPPEMRNAFETDFNARIKHNLEKGDPFKYAVYKIMGRQEIHKKNIPHVIVTTEDWMWLQLNLVRETPLVGTAAGLGKSSLGGGGGSYSLRDLGALVVKYGEDDLAENRLRPLVYFQRLLLTCQFEKAVSFLYEAGLETDAVHFAIALTYYGLLRIPDAKNQSETEIFTGKTTTTTPTPGLGSSLGGSHHHPHHHRPNASTMGQPHQESTISHCNFARLIQRYIRNFVRIDPPAALQYAYLVSLNADAPGSLGDEQVQACWDMIRAIILETRSYGLVLNEKTPSGQPVPSVLMRDVKLVKVRNPEEAVRDLIGKLAASAPADLPLNDRIELYKLAGQYDKIMGAINKALSDSLDQPGSSTNDASILQGEQQDDLLAFVKYKLDALQQDGIQVSSAGQVAAQQLQTLRQAKAYSERGDFARALAAVQESDLIPLDKDVPGITRAAEDFKHVDDTVTSKIDKVLLMTMNAIFELNQRLKTATSVSSQGAEGSGVGKAEQVHRLKKQERALMMFAGMLRYRLSSETYAQLAHYDAFF